ncbi:MAG: amidase [Myxococcales bacterium]|nr:amidase [Myxococcales bacterium]
MTIEDYARADATELASWVARGDVKPEELAETAFRAIERINPELNAVLQVLRESALEAISRNLPQGSFRGVPFLIKELVCHAAGVRCEMGSRLSDGYTPSDDTELMARFRRAGLVLVGTTQTPEFGYNPTTETVRFGPVHNPWNPGHSAGGSSGGSGAAVAAGLVPLAHANDGGGSIRIPASCNGLVGLKPTRDRIPSGPDLGDLLYGLATEFAVSRSVRDSAALLDAVAGPDVGAPGLIAPPPRPYLEEVGRDPGTLRIAFTSQSPSGRAVDSDCADAVALTVKHLEALGHELVEAAPPLDWESFLDDTHILWTAFSAHSVDGTAALLGRKASPENLEAVTWACVEEGRRYSAGDLTRALDGVNRVSREVGAFFAGIDVLITPTMARPPVPLGEVDQNAAGLSARAWTQQVFEYCAFTPLFNTTGQPALSLPLHEGRDHLPIGVQCVGRFGDESSLFRLAGQLETSLPWKDRTPQLHVTRDVEGAR